jgi:hypothetical protein
VATSLGGRKDSRFQALGQPAPDRKSVYAPVGNAGASYRRRSARSCAAAERLLSSRLRTPRVKSEGQEQRSLDAEARFPNSQTKIPGVKRTAALVARTPDCEEKRVMAEI